MHVIIMHILSIKNNVYWYQKYERVVHYYSLNIYVVGFEHTINHKGLYI